MSFVFAECRANDNVSLASIGLPSSWL